jgi:hypothetical protein
MIHRTSYHWTLRFILDSEKLCKITKEKEIKEEEEKRQKERLGRSCEGRGQKREIVNCERKWRSMKR